MTSNRTLLIVTGMSGAGKTQVIRTLEDLGFYCVDNMPLALFPKFLELLEGAGADLGPRFALGLDLREGHLDERFPQVYEALRKSTLRVRILFVDSRDDVLLRRFSETRRPHPLAPKGSVEEGIAVERERLAAIKEHADKVLDTSDTTIHELRRSVESEASAFAEPRTLTVNVVSFGFAHGLPPEASLVFDVRFLPNPHFVPELRPLTGEDPEVYEYVCGSAEGGALVDRLADLLAYLLPQYHREGKTYLTVAVGCTGGRHRSVAVARRLYDILRGDKTLSVNLIHRDHKR